MKFAIVRLYSVGRGTGPAQPGAAHPVCDAMMSRAIVKKPPQLPTNYEAAARAIAECSRIDECQDWADKAAAMESYARQAEDDTLFAYARRIKARAIRRCGELLKQVKPGNGANQNIPDGADRKVTRESAAADAGLSERQRVTALRVATVPQEEFDAQVESDHPVSWCGDRSKHV